MTLPGVGPLPLSGFEHPWLAVLVVVPIGLLSVYLVAQMRQRRRVRRFTEPDLLDSVVPRRPRPLRHLPIGVALASLVLLIVALAGPTRDMHIPRNRAVIMLVIDVSQSMRSTDVPPTRLDAARQAAEEFTKRLTPGINLGLVSFAGTANLLVPPTPQHEATLAGLQNLRPDNSTATGEALFTALDAITTAGSVMSGTETPPPARIVLLSDGGENKPGNPNNPRGAFTAARAAKDHGVPISTIAFGTKAGYVELNDQRLPVPVDPNEMVTIAQLSGGQTYTASDVDQLNRSYAAIQEQVGYQTVQAPASAGWLRLGVLTAAVAAVLALLINRRLPV
ncbi:VWA domain-containing protein [Mycobacterium sp.]|uniref:VWA domain-containing protein n=1 Tax=Mycobacterium sp. TaxID=1785 RepID=UPI002CDEF980|nr:VWA domain-containing protein [Mycobacterium sp.]HME49231.1 VWA domain-containing protein [Mycobacterium sp.]